MSAFFSIAIPTYEMGGRGRSFLEFSFKQFRSQNFPDFEVVVSDHSRNDDIRSLCEEWKHVLDIKYIHNPHDLGNSSANMNNAIKHCTGQWIKILFQDDFLYTDNSLKLLYECIINDTNVNWIVSSCFVYDESGATTRNYRPHWNDTIVYGNNTIGSPSVICMRNVENNVSFDERLIYLMDGDFYKKMFDRYGIPTFLNDMTVCNRVWSKQVTNSITPELIEKETKIIEHDYPR